MDNDYKQDIELKVVRIICEEKDNTEDNSQGTGFFIADNIIITAAHVVNKYVENPSDYTIEIIAKNSSIKYEVDKIIDEKNTAVKLLKLKQKLSGTMPLKMLTDFEIKRDSFCEWYGYPSAEVEDGSWIKGNIITDSGESENVDWKVDFEAQFSSFEGMSGSPIFINGRVIGIMQVEITQDRKTVSLGFTAIDTIKPTLIGNYYEVYSDIQKIEDLKSDGYNIKTISDIDNDLKKMVKSQYKLSLDFFEIDDSEFIKNLRGKIEDCDRSIHIQGISKEETMYSIVNELTKYSYPIIIVRDKATWERLGGKIKKYILLVDFYSEEDIISITNNINIYIYTDSDKCTKNHIKLRRRTKRIIEEKLRSIGVKDVYNLLEKNNGFYSSIKRSILEGRNTDNGINWKDKTGDSFIAALLCGKWTDNEYDKKILECLSGKKYSDFMKDIMPFMKDESPFVVKFKTNYNKFYNYYIADIELAWTYLGERISHDKWLDFLEAFNNVITTIDQDFKESLEKEYYVGSIEKIKYSSRLKNGMIRSFIYKKLLNNEESIDSEKIKEILNDINNKMKWAYYAQFMSALAEAFPRIIIQKLERSIYKPEFKELFEEGNFNSVFKKQYYINILWCIEVLLSYKKYIPEAVKLLIEINKYNIRYKQANSPKDTLVKVFCGWVNVAPISQKQKIELASKYIDDIWQIIFDSLPRQGRSVAISNIVTPQYIQNEDIVNFSYVELNEIYTKYEELCIDNINGHIKRLENILDVFDIFPKDLSERIISKYNEFLKTAKDKGKLILTMKLRKKIYDNRFYRGPFWKMSEDKIAILENMLENISFQNKLYPYLYWLQTTESEHPILNPKPYNKKDNVSFENDENRKIYNMKMKNVFHEFLSIEKNKEKYKGILELVKLAISEQTILAKNNSAWQMNIGINIVRYCTNNVFELKFYKELLKIPYIEKIIYEYCIRTLKRDEKINILKAVKDITIDYSKNLYVDLLVVGDLREDNPIIFSIDDSELQELYWSRWNPYDFYFKSVESFNKILDSLMKVDECSAYIFVIHESMSSLEVNEIIKVLYKIKKFKKIDMNKKVDGKFYLEEIIKYFNCVKLSDKNRKMLSEIEFYLSPILDWNVLVDMQHEFKFNPQYYCDIIDKVFKHGEDEEVMKNEDEIRMYNELYNKVKFCPGEKNGDVNSEELKKWTSGFKEKLNKQKQGKLYPSLLGRLFAYSPVGTDGLYPHKAVREIIEKLDSEAFDIFKRNYVIEICNKRGAYYTTAGKEEKEMALRYKENADRLREALSCNTSKLYDDLYTVYINQSESERRGAENANF